LLYDHSANQSLDLMSENFPKLSQEVCQRERKLLQSLFAALVRTSHLILILFYYFIAEKGKPASSNQIPLISGTVAGALTFITLIIVLVVRKRYL